MFNYVCYHLHSDISNAVTNVDSVTKYQEYVEKAKEYGMTAMGFSEHGSTMEWWHKKCAIEDAGMKYIHGVEAYLTTTLEEKVRDNYHCVLIARNLEGFYELNKLVSSSFNRNDNHFYYVPRISFDELFNTSENIIITTACIGGVLGKGDEEAKERYLEFLSSNKERCFLEVGHHIDERQVVYNKRLFELSKDYSLPLIAGTDTHVLNELHEKGRSILQKAKKINFPDEDKWDLKFHSYDELVNAYEIQGSLPREIYLEAIDNTNLLADMVEEFKLDRGTKYPHIYDNPEEVFKEKIDAARANNPLLKERYTDEELDAVINEELEVYKQTESIDFMLLQTYLREWEKENGIQCGYGRGSVSGSMIAYILGITNMDSMRFGLNFFRFMNPSRVTNADIDTDYSAVDRDKVKEFLLKDRMGLDNIKSAEIITFNTIAMKGAIKDVARALGMPLDEAQRISNAVKQEGKNWYIDDSYRKKYRELFEYVDIVNGTIVSIGTHPSGVLISDLPIDETIGLCTTSSSPYPVSVINMKELDDLMYVKLDALGLDNIGIINDTCKAAGIERLTPDNVDLEDEAVWNSIRDDTTLIFQWESNSAQIYLKKFMSDKTIAKAREVNPNFSYIKWLSFGNGLIRPGCASFRDSIANGEINQTGFKELDDMLSATFGRITMQEDIMKFCKLFCGYSDAESDTVRRGVAKKGGTEKFIGEIHDRFISYSHETYGMPEDRLEEIFVPIKQGILDASDYAFSWNHSDSYSMIGYICGYLRYYYPYEFITSALNIFSDDSNKTSEIGKYANKVGIKITSPKWGISGPNYFYNKEQGIIAKGLSSIKFLGEKVAKELQDVSERNTFSSFVDLLYTINEETSLDTRQLDILIKIDFFSEFGNQRELLYISDLFYNKFKRGQAKKISKSIVDGTELEGAVKKYAIGLNKNGDEAKSYTLLDIKSILKQLEKEIKESEMPDLEATVKAKNFYENMGYMGYTTGKEEDRRKLFVQDIYPLKRKKDGKQFGYSIVTKSIGSGIESRFTIFNRVFDRDPIEKEDFIVCKGYERDGKYFTMTNYSKVV